MLEVKTAAGKTFPVSWIGISDFDGSLRFEVQGGDLAELFAVFSDPEETVCLTRVFDEDRKDFLGFTKMKGVELMATGNVVVRLIKE